MADIGKKFSSGSAALNLLKSYEKDDSTKADNHDKVGAKRTLENEIDANEPEKKKVTMNISASKPSSEPKKSMFKKSFGPGIKMNIGGQKNKDPAPAQKPKAMSVAKAFQDEDSDEEEMPPEARMRMRNIGRDTPTAAGPNSYGKSNLGFCDRQKIIERKLKDEMDKVCDESDDR